MIFLGIENVCRLTQQFVFLSILSKFLSNYKFSEYCLAVSIVTPLYMFSALQLRTLSASEGQDSDFPLVSYFAVRFLGNCFLLSVAILVAMLWDNTLDFILLTFVVALVRTVDLISELIYGVMQSHKKEKRIATLAVIKCCINTTAAYILLSYEMPLGLVIFLIAFASVGFSIPMEYCWFYKKIKNDRLRTQRDQTFSYFNSVKQLLLLSVPFAVLSCLGAASFVIPRFWLGHDQVGPYVANATVFAGLTTLFGVIGQSMLPGNAELVRERRGRVIQRIWIVLVAVGVGAGLVTYAFSLFFGQDFMLIVFNQEIASERNSFLILAFGTLVSFPLVQISWLILSNRNYKIMSVFVASGASVSFVASACLVPFYGPEGAAMASIISNLIMLCVGSYIVNRVSGKMMAVA